MIAVWLDRPAYSALVLGLSAACAAALRRGEHLPVSVARIGLPGALWITAAGHGSAVRYAPPADTCLVRLGGDALDALEGGELVFLSAPPGAWRGAEPPLPSLIVLLQEATEMALYHELVRRGLLLPEPVIEAALPLAAPGAVAITHTETT